MSARHLTGFNEETDLKAVRQILANPEKYRFQEGLWRWAEQWRQDHPRLFLRAEQRVPQQASLFREES